MKKTVRKKYDWMYCGITFTGLHFSYDPYSFGMFEFSKSPEILPGCEEALKESAKAYSSNIFEESTIKPTRLRTYFFNVTEKEVVRQGRLWAKEALSLLSFVMPISYELKLLRPGFLFNLTTGQVMPLKPTAQETFGSQMHFQAFMDEYSTQPYHVLNLLLSTDPNAFGELGKALRRSSHWSGLARQADDDGEKLLLHWMACETLTRVTEGETIIPKLLAALGFPRSRYWNNLPQFEKEKLEEVKEFKAWSKLLVNLFDRYRDARNDIAHSGYRELDLSSRFNSTESRILKQAIKLLTPRIQRLAIDGLILRIRTLADMWTRYSDCKCFGRINPLANDVEGTIIFSLKTARDDSD